MADFIQQLKRDNPNVQAIVGRGETDKEYPDGSLIRSVAIDFEFCVKEGEELLQFAELVFDRSFNELHGVYDDLNLDLDAIYRYDLKSSALTENEYFGFNEPNFKRSGTETIMHRLLSKIDSTRVFDIFRSGIIIQLLYTPRK